MTILSTFGGTSGVDTGDIPASLRFRSAASAYLSRTPGSTTDRAKWTWSGWVKPADFGADKFLFGAAVDANNRCGLLFNIGSLVFFSIMGGTTRFNKISSALFRDPTAFYHIVCAFDSTNATTEDRVKLYVNNTRITSWSTNTFVDLTNHAVNDSTAVHIIGRRPESAANYYDGYMSRIAFVDGQALTPSSFGYLNTEINEWVSKSQSAVKSVVDAGGTNSFMLDFDDATSLTTLGYDKSSKGNHWTLNNFSLTAGTNYDHMLDVPGNSYCTLNPLASTLSSASNGNLHVTTNVGGYGGGMLGSIAVSSGKWYWETSIVANGGSAGQAPVVAVSLATTPLSGSNSYYNGDNLTYYGANGNKLRYTGGGYTNAAYGASYTVGDIIGVAFDLDAGTLTFYKNGVSQGQAYSGLSGTWCPSILDGSTGGTTRANFGQQPFAYTPPAGFKALCQRNLPDPAILNPENGFVSVIATEDNIYSTLAAARSGWTDYVDILKNRAASESWAWQFSHDSSNEYAVAASSLVRQAKRTQSGSDNWVGYSIRVGAACGTAAGSVSHTNGAATTITHNVGVSARQLILLFNRAGGSAVPVYHPDLTSGELLDLCTTAADAASTAITSVGTNSFQIGSGVATGTYDYLVCSEISQFFDLGKWTGNASADGAYFDAGHKPKMLYAKALSTTDDHRVYDELRPGYNVQGGVVLANTNAAETTTAEMDITAFGMKARIATAPNAAQTYVTASWASVASKYSLAR